MPFVIYPDKKGYIGINAYEWLEDEKAICICIAEKKNWKLLRPSFKSVCEKSKNRIRIKSLHIILKKIRNLVYDIKSKHNMWRWICRLKKQSGIY